MAKACYALWDATCFRITIKNASQCPPESIVAVVRRPSKPTESPQPLECALNDPNME